MFPQSLAKIQKRCNSPQLSACAENAPIEVSLILSKFQHFSDIFNTMLYIYLYGFLWFMESVHKDFLFDHFDVALVFFRWVVKT